MARKSQAAAKSPRIRSSGAQPSDLPAFAKPRVAAIARDMRRAEYARETKQILWQTAKIVGTCALIALALGIALHLAIRKADARGHDWFFGHVPPTGKCPGREIAVSFYDCCGRHTANGERFDPNGNTAAHRSMAFGSTFDLTNPLTNLSLTVRINDRGPNGCGKMSCAHREARGLKTLTLDLARGAAKRLGLRQNGWVCAS